MARLMSVAFTEQAVRDRTKTVTRRKGWLFAKPGDRIALCRKVMGRKPGEPLERICDVEIVSVRREPLQMLTMAPLTYGHREVIREGFPGMPPAHFVREFFIVAQGMGIEDEVTRIEWRYIETCCGQEMYRCSAEHTDGKNRLHCRSCTRNVEVA
jgi:hypothetical protein